MITKTFLLPFCSPAQLFTRSLLLLGGAGVVLAYGLRNRLAPTLSAGDVASPMRQPSRVRESSGRARSVPRGRLAFVLFLFAIQGWANSAIEPVPRTDDWLKRHEAFVKLARQAEPKVIFLGDSITDYWRREDPNKGGLRVWEKYFVPLHAVNLGIASDRTQHLLWRIKHGEIDGVHPQAIVLMIGTNNTGLEPDKLTLRNTSAETAAGVAAIVQVLREKLPETRILLLAIFPRGKKQDPQRSQVAEINATLAKLEDGKAVHFLDIGAAFLAVDGSLSRDIMPDLLHPNERGYEIWATAIQKPLRQLLDAALVAPSK